MTVDTSKEDDGCDVIPQRFHVQNGKRLSIPNNAQSVISSEGNPGKQFDSRVLPRPLPEDRFLTTRISMNRRAASHRCRRAWPPPSHDPRHITAGRDGMTITPTCPWLDYPFLTNTDPGDSQGKGPWKLIIISKSN